MKKLRRVTQQNSHEFPILNANLDIAFRSASILTLQNQIDELSAKLEQQKVEFDHSVAEAQNSECKHLTEPVTIEKRIRNFLLRAPMTTVIGEQCRHCGKYFPNSG